MVEENYVNFREDTIKYGENNIIIHHPLNSYYRTPRSHGLLSFGGHDLAKSVLLQDIKVFYLEFEGDPPTDHEEWANPLRIKVLTSLLHENWNWYLSFIGSIKNTERKPQFTSIQKDIKDTYITKHNLNFTYVQSEEETGEVIKRLFIETPKKLLASVINRYWIEETDFYPIQGYQLPPASIHLLRKWDAMARDDKLFKEVLDEVFLAFYTFPTENRNIVFLTKKLSYTEITDMIQLNDLRFHAKTITQATFQ